MSSCSVETDKNGTDNLPYSATATPMDNYNNNYNDEGEASTTTNNTQIKLPHEQDGIRNVFYSSTAKPMNNHTNNDNDKVEAYPINNNTTITLSHK